MDANIAYPICMIILIAYSTWIVAGQRKTIDKLTDKLMAKDYNEYKRHREPFQDTKDAPKPRRPMSFHDDPNIEIEDDNLN